VVGFPLLGVVDEQVAGLLVDVRDGACLTALGRDLVADREVLRGEVPIIPGARFLFAFDEAFLVVAEAFEPAASRPSRSQPGHTAATG
jgi:hypothetical protein